MRMTTGKIRVPFFRLSPPDEEIAAVADVIRSGWLTTAGVTAEFERRFAEFVGVRHALAVNSGTAALHLALEAVGVGPGDFVMVPVHTFTATAEVVRYLGAEVLFGDVDKETFCIDAREDVQERLHGKIFKMLNGKKKNSGNNLKAIMPVHFGGHPCDMDSIMKLARDLAFKVIEDAAHALPCRYAWKNGGSSAIGTIGDATCFSFYANKTITTGEGGMLVTSQDEFASRIKVMRLHGIDRDIWDRYKSDKPSWHYEVVEPGYKYNMTDIASAIGIKQLAKCRIFHQRRMEIAQFYLDNLSGIEGLRLPVLKCDFGEHAWHLFVILVEPPKTGGRILRNDFINRLADMGVATSVHYIPLHFQPYYRERYRLRPEDFPNSTWVYERCVSLPIFPDMHDEEVEYVAACVKKVLIG
jgi:dTDP-4-amino-4,6-dideoxygalactose transaminase